MIYIEMCVAEGVHKFSRQEIRDLCDHRREQRVARDIEGNAQEGVGRTLVELAGQASVGDVELEQAVAGCERHLVEIGRIPGAHDEAAGIGISTYLIDNPS